MDSFPSMPHCNNDMKFSKFYLLDNTTEVLIQQALDELCKGRTTLVVAHRLSTIRNADEIAVVMDGRITERGTHEELMAADGTYKNLYALQFRDNDLFE